LRLDCYLKTGCSVHYWKIY